MDRDHAIKRAKDMRESQAERIKVAQDSRQPFGVRYAAVIQAEELDEAARGFDKIAEMTRGKTR